MVLQGHLPPTPLLLPFSLDGGSGGPPFPELSGFGPGGRVTGSAGFLPLLLGPAASLAPLMFGVFRRWSIFLGRGRGVSPFLRVFPDGDLPKNHSALSVYIGSFPLI